MYLPKRFENLNIDRSLAVMRAAPLATVISVDADGQPFVSHLPLVAEQDGEKVRLIGHLARANAHWKLLSERPATAIFHGPNAYISPTWYAKNDVPTWNYAVAWTPWPLRCREPRCSRLDGGVVREMTDGYVLCFGRPRSNSSIQ